MRTKDEILKQYSEEWLDSNDGKAISIVINLNMLEVWIDIRDILNESLIDRGTMMTNPDLRP